MRKLNAFLVLLLLLVSCSNKTQLKVTHYKNEDVDIYIHSDKEMGVVFEFEKLSFGGQGHYEYISDDIYILEVDDKGHAYYLIENEEKLFLIDSKYSIEEIEAGDYTPTYILREVVE